MDETAARRLAAFIAARDLLIQQGIGCPGCIAKLAGQIDTFLATGETDQIEHLPATNEPSDDDPAPEGKVLKFDPKKVN